MNHFGSWAKLAWAIIFASGFLELSFFISSEARTRAEAPSFILDALAAVILPSLSNAGLRFGILSNLALLGSSSCSTRVEPFLPLTSILQSSFAKWFFS